MREIFICYKILFLLFCTCPAQQLGEIYQLGDGNDFCAAIKRENFKYHQREQETDNWCWAACIQMVMHYQGVDLTQSDIVVKAFGNVENRGADCGTIVRAANGWSHNGVVLQAWEQDNLSPKDLIDALAFKYPVIIGLDIPGQVAGHAYVLTAIYFRYGDMDRKIPYRVRLRDPWPTNPDVYETDWEDFRSRINCIVHITH